MWFKTYESQATATHQGYANLDNVAQLQVLGAGSQWYVAAQHVNSSTNDTNTPGTANLTPFHATEAEAYAVMEKIAVLLLAVDAEVL